jgi:benzoyl-CoA reductase subunit C
VSARPEAARARSDLVARAEELVADAGVGAVRAWKAKNPGGKAIGWLPVFAPRELIHAVGALPVGILGGGEMEIVRGDACFQSYICHLPRSTVELGLNGSLDVLDGMIFPSTCDVIRNLSGMWQILFPDRAVWYLDLPQNFDPAIGGAFFEGELRTLLSGLETLAGTTAGEERLRHSIRLFDENRALVERLYDLRADQPWQVPSSELFAIVRAGCVLPVEEHDAMLRAYLDAAQSDRRPPRDMARVAVRGWFCEPPPLDLVKSLERSGCFIVDDDWMLVARWFRGPIGPGDDPLRRLACAFLDRSIPCPSVFQEHGRKGDAVVEAARRARAEGVVFAAPSFCDPALLEQPMSMAAVKDAGIPCTAFLYSENTGQFQVIREQAGTFADSIRLS